MKWEEIRIEYPEQWLVIEALEAHSADHFRYLESIAVVATCANGGEALRTYREYHHRYPERELYFVHTQRMDLDIEERIWVGIRGKDAAYPV